MPKDKSLPVDAEMYQRILSVRDSMQVKLDQAAREMAGFNERTLEFGKIHVALLLEIMKEVWALNEQIALLYPGGKN